MSECTIPSQLLTTRKYLTFWTRLGAVIALFNSHLRLNALTHSFTYIGTFFSSLKMTTASTRVLFVSMSQQYTERRKKIKNKKRRSNYAVYCVRFILFFFLCYWQSNNFSLLLHQQVHFPAFCYLNTTNVISERCNDVQVSLTVPMNIFTLLLVSFVIFFLLLSRAS